jgi:hypothetical protein
VSFFLAAAQATLTSPPSLTKKNWVQKNCPFHHPLNCYWSGYYGWVMAILLDQPWLFMLGAGYGASLMQGVAHEHCKEAANLPELAKRDGDERAGDEIGHVSYFPVLIIHSAHESLFGGDEKNKSQ